MFEKKSSFYSKSAANLNLIKKFGNIFVHHNVRKISFFLQIYHIFFENINSSQNLRTISILFKICEKSGLKSNFWKSQNKSKFSNKSCFQGNLYKNLNFNNNFWFESIFSPNFGFRQKYRKKFQFFFFLNLELSQFLFISVVILMIEKYQFFKNLCYNVRKISILYKSSKYFQKSRFH